MDWTARFLPPVLHEPCNPTPILGVHRIATYTRFSMLKKLDFNPVPDFHGLTSRSSPGLRTLHLTRHINQQKLRLSQSYGVFLCYRTLHFSLYVCLFIKKKKKKVRLNKHKAKPNIKLNILIVKILVLTRFGVSIENI